MTIAGPAFDQLVAGIVNCMPGHAKFLNSALGTLTSSEVDEANAYLRYLLQSHGVDFLVSAYKTLIDDTIAAQIDFLRTKQYRHSTLADVADSVYRDHDYMKRYMLGLALSTFLWANHIQIYRFFQRKLPSGRAHYLEIGPGHGFFLLHAIRRHTHEHYTGVDISPASIALTNDVVRYFGGCDTLDLMQMDFLDDRALRGPFDTIVMGEVIEHVERPEAFLQRIAELATPQTHIFVTTCVNAPAIDHIFLFRQVDEVEKMLSDCGFRIRDSLILPTPGKSLKQCVVNDLPINLAYVVGL